MDAQPSHSPSNFTQCALAIKYSGLISDCEKGFRPKLNFSALISAFVTGKSTTFDLDQIPFSTCNALRLLLFYAMPLRECEKGLEPGQSLLRPTHNATKLCEKRQPTTYNA